MLYCRHFALGIFGLCHCCVIALHCFTRGGCQLQYFYLSTYNTNLKARLWNALIYCPTLRRHMKQGVRKKITKMSGVLTFIIFRQYVDSFVNVYL